MEADPNLEAMLERVESEEEQAPYGALKDAAGSELDPIIEAWLREAYTGEGLVRTGSKVEALGLAPYPTGLSGQYAMVVGWVRGTLGCSKCAYGRGKSTKGCPGCRSSLRAWAYHQKVIGREMPWAEKEVQDEE